MSTLIDNVAELTAEIADVKEQRADEAERHCKVDGELLGRLNSLETERLHAAAGTSDEDLRLARGLVEIRGDVGRLAHSLVVDAVEDIAAGCPTLRHEYLALKDYDGHTYQRCDFTYGMAPRHGIVVFGIGLTDAARTMISKWGQILGGPNGENSQAMIRYLLNLQEAGVA